MQECKLINFVGTAVSCNMSVDVFGRDLERVGGSRGPPGVRFKVTSDGQYDIDNKRLCNVAKPIQSGVAINLETLQRIVITEIKRLRDVIDKLRKGLDTLNLIFEADRDEFNVKLLGIQYVIRSNDNAAPSS